MINELDRACEIALLTCMGVKPEENVLIISDTTKHEIGYALHLNALRLGLNSTYVEMIPLEINGQEPPAEIGKMMKRYDVVLCPTAKSLTHTDARREASKDGVRVATFPGITKDVMIRGMNADYNKIAARSIKLKEILESKSSVRVTSPLGTDISFSIKGRTSYASKGLFHAKGESGNLPTGETFLAPVENTAQGVLYIDGSIASIGLIQGENVVIEVSNGKATKISGGENATKLDQMLSKVGPEAYNIAEFGIGTNDSAKLSGLILEDEKVMGTIHIALGNNLSMGGSISVPIHLDGVITEPTVYLDNELLMKDGKFVIDIG